MSSDRDESLFANSTMSFGDHIEELRGALARALFGLAIGVGIAFFFADEAVQWIEKPLKDGLTQFNVAKATSDFDDELSPEQLSLITESRMAPTEMYFESEMLLDQMRATYPGKMPEFISTKYEFQADELTDRVAMIAAALTKAPAKQSFQELVHQQLGDSKTQLEKLASAKSVADSDAAELAVILNGLLHKSEIAKGVTEEMVKSLHASVEQRDAVQSLLTQAEFDPALAPRINRLLMTAAYEPSMPQQNRILCD